MVDTLGRISAIHRGDVACASGERPSGAPSRLRRHGALAGLDGGVPNRTGDLPVSSANNAGCQWHLSRLLSSLHDQPEHLASRLLYRFGSIARISQASEIELRQTANEGENWVDALIAVRQLMQDGLRETLVRTQIGENPDALTAYLLATMQNLCEERMLAIFADAAGYIIAEEVVAHGSQKGLFVTPRNLFGRALNLDARRIILAHNHPSGCATPSKRDVAQTRVLSKMAVGLGLMIEDHLIIGYRQVTSMKNRGLM